MALDEATRGFLARMAATGEPPLEQLPVADARAVVAAFRDFYGPAPAMARVEDITIDAHDGGSFGARLLVPSEPARGVIVYYHGGGWVIGSPDDYEHLGRAVASRTGCAVVLVGYRRAPEHRYPAAVEDAWTALRWTAVHAADIAGAEAPLIVAGDSAGGNLAAVVCRRARENGPDVALQVLVYPVCDCDLDHPGYREPSNQLMLTRAAMAWFWDHYLPQEALREHPDASPLRAEDLAGVAPAVIVTAEHDVLRAEGEAYAARLRGAGVPVEERCFAGQMHGFFAMVNILPGQAPAMDYVIEAIDRKLG
jgi:acetyl esterase